MKTSTGNNLGEEIRLGTILHADRTTQISQPQTRKDQLRAQGLGSRIQGFGVYRSGFRTRLEGRGHFEKKKKKVAPGNLRDTGIVRRVWGS